MELLRQDVTFYNNLRNECEDVKGEIFRPQT